MSEFLEHLKSDLAEAQKRFAHFQAQLQSSQAAFQAAAADVQSYQRVVDAQTKKEELDSQQSKSPQEAARIATASPAPTPEVAEGSSSVNKTQMIRDALRQHAGATPADLMEYTGGQIGRAYLYSVLKRLREKEEVIVRRKKYYWKGEAKIEEVRKSQDVVQ